MDKAQECPDCNGTGADFSFTMNPLDMPSGKDCPKCNGKGELFTPPTDEGVREKIAEIVFLEFSEPYAEDGHERWLYVKSNKSYTATQKKVYHTTDSILAIIKEAGYVKLGKGEHISGVGTINAKDTDSMDEVEYGK